MKKILIFILLPAFCNAQKIAENRVDDFTNRHITRTSWELIDGTSGFYAHIRISDIDSAVFLNLRWIHDGGIGIVKQGANVMFKLANDSVVTLHALETSVSCRGCGAVDFGGSGAIGYNITLVMSSKDVYALSKTPVKKIRIYLSDGYIEHSIKEKKSLVLMNEITLLGKNI